MGLNPKLLRAPISASPVRLISFAKHKFCVSLISLSGGLKLELEALLNSSKELKPVLDRLVLSP
jgi:predicted Na+-dependent transporter